MKMLKKLSKILTLFIVFSFIISPTFALAKNDNHKENKNKNQYKKEMNLRFEKKQIDDDSDERFKKCFKTWGHLVAPGWIKANGQASVDINCVMPFGISKKFRGQNASSTPSTPDTIAPIMTDIVIIPGLTRAVVDWKTNEPSNSIIFYSTTTPVNTTTSMSKNNSFMTKMHRLVLSELSASTTYHVIIQSKDSSGNISTSNQYSFTTKTAALDTKSPTISDVVAIVGTTTVNLGWKTDEPATTKVYYSTTTPINTLSLFTNLIENVNLVTNHTLSLFGLSTSTKYYLLIESKDSSGNINRTDEFSVITSTN